MARGRFEGLDLIYVVPALREEHLLGHLGRCMRAGGLVRVKDLATTLVDRRTFQPPWTLPCNLNRLAEKLRPVFNSGQALLQNHTCLPAHLPFVTAVNLPRVLAHALEGVSHRGLASAIGLGGNFAESKPAMRICPTCVRQDELEHGFSFWHREHALTSVVVCAQHGRPLMTGCGNCRFSQAGCREPLMPGRKCWCGDPLRSVAPDLSAAERVVMTRMARYGCELLNGALDGRNADDVGAYLQFASHQAGFAAGANVRSRRLVKELSAKYLPAVQATLNARLDGNAAWAQRTFGSGRTNSVLGRNLMLFDFFGERLPTADDFAMSCKHREMMARTRIAAQRASIGTEAEVLADRQRIERFLREKPGASRTDALKALGRVVMRARERDAQWYDKLLPTKPRGGRPDAECQRLQYLADLDVRASAHIKRRKSELLAHRGGFPKAITKTALLKGLPSGNALNEELLASLPKTSAALIEAVETRHQFQRRFALNILRREGAEPLEKRIFEAYRRTGLSPSEVEALNFALVEEEQWPIRHPGIGF